MGLCGILRARRQLTSLKSRILDLFILLLRTWRDLVSHTSVEQEVPEIHKPTTGCTPSNRISEISAYFHDVIPQ